MLARRAVKISRRSDAAAFSPDPQGRTDSNEAGWRMSSWGGIPLRLSCWRGAGGLSWARRLLDRSDDRSRRPAGTRVRRIHPLRNDETRAREDFRRQLHEEGGLSALALLAAIDRQLGLYDEALDG